MKPQESFNNQPSKMSQEMNTITFGLRACKMKQPKPLKSFYSLT